MEVVMPAALRMSAARSAMGLTWGEVSSVVGDAERDGDLVLGDDGLGVVALLVAAVGRRHRAGVGVGDVGLLGPLCVFLPGRRRLGLAPDHLLPRCLLELPGGLSPS